MNKPKRLMLVGACLLGLLATAGVAGAFTTNAVQNGDFETGVIAPWVPFTTVNGTNGAGLPNVVPFDTTGSGASLAAHFNVGEVNFTFGDYEGGGIYQSFGGEGQYSVSADVAARTPFSNYSCGYFTLWVDDNLIDSANFGTYPSNPCLSGTTYRAHLAGLINLPLGTHTAYVEIERPWTSVIGTTPDEYVDNIKVIRKLTRVQPPTHTAPAAAPVVPNAPSGVAATGVVSP